MQRRNAAPQNSWWRNWAFSLYHRFSQPKYSKSSKTSAKGVNSVLILFEALDPHCLHRHFKNLGFHSEMVGYFADNLEHLEGGYSSFNNQSLNWLGLPKGDWVKPLNELNRHLLISIHHEGCLPLNFLAREQNATMKIGLFDKWSLFDVVLEGHEDSCTKVANHILSFTQTLNQFAHAKS
jgi:hypothetical protein